MKNESDLIPLDCDSRVVENLSNYKNLERRRTAISFWLKEVLSKSVETKQLLNKEDVALDLIFQYLCMNKLAEATDIGLKLIFIKP